MKINLRNLALSACSLAAVSVQAYPPHEGGPHERDRSIIQCESKEHRPNRCSAGGPIRRVLIRHQHSHSPCIEGHSWGYTEHTIWVNSGCRASFEVIYRHH